MKQTGIPLTVIVITHRKDARFAAAVASARPAAEVLIADYTRKAPISDFAAVRNTWLAKARHEWVFFLDSDECIEPKSWPHIETLIRKTDLAGVWIRRNDIFYGKKLRFGETGRTWVLRLVRRKNARFSGAVHEKATVQGNTQRSRISLQHTSHPSITEFLTDVVTYSQLAARYQHDSRLPVWLLAVKTVLYPAGKFCVNFFIKFGWLDGWRGATYALVMSIHSLCVRVFSYEDHL